MPSRSVIASCAAALVLVSVWGCDQKVDEGDDKLTEGNQSVDVVYYDSIETVLFDNLETLYMFNDAPVVNLTDVVMGSGLFVSTDGLWVNFVGTDGYSPLGNSNCVTDYVPTAASVLDNGYIERGTRRLLWEESLEMPQCVSVKDVETIYVADAPEDLPVGGDADSDTDTDTDSDSDADTDTDTDTDTDSAVVTVDYGGDTEDVELVGLDIEDIGGVPVVLLTTILEQTEFVFDLASVTLSIEGTDGYNPVDEGTCTECLPAAGDLADRAGIDPVTRDIEWHPDLEFSGCAFVKEVGIVYVLDN